MTTVVASAAALVTAAGLVVLVGGVLRTRQLAASFALALDFWLGAGLLRLAARPGWGDLAVTAVVLVVRRVVGRALRARPLGSPP